MKTTRHFDFNFKPLQLYYSLVVEGNVPNTQTYSADFDEWTPDYTLAHLSIQPDIRIVDKDRILVNESNPYDGLKANRMLSNIRWFEQTGKTERKEINSSNQSFEITIDNTSDQNGRIVVKKNATTDSPITLTFEADLVDTRTGQTYNIVSQIAVTCRNESTYAPTLEIDAPTSVLYNPLRDSATMKITPRFLMAGQSVDSGNTLLIWEKYRGENGWSDVIPNSADDRECSIATGGVLIINKSLINSENKYRLRVAYSSDGNPMKKDIDDSVMRFCTVTRRIPEFWYEIIGVPTSIPVGTVALFPQIRLYDSVGDIDNSKALAAGILPIWYAAPDRDAGSLDFDEVDSGYSPEIPTSYISPAYGAVIEVSFEHWGNDAIATDNNGYILTDNDGTAFII